MTKVILILMTVVLWSGCGVNPPILSVFDESGWSPSTGPEGQPLELYQGKDSAGNRIDYQFYVSGADTIKHGDYNVYFENGDHSYSIGFKKGKRHEWSISYSLQKCVEDSKGHMECHTIIDKWDRDYYREDKCVNHNGAKCEGDEYSDY